MKCINWMNAIGTEGEREREQLPCARIVIPCFFCLTHKTITAASSTWFTLLFSKVKCNNFLTKFATENFISFLFQQISYNTIEMSDVQPHNTRKRRTYGNDEWNKKFKIDNGPVTRTQIVADKSDVSKAMFNGKTAGNTIHMPDFLKYSNTWTWQPNRLKMLYLRCCAWDKASTIVVNFLANHSTMKMFAVVWVLLFNTNI